MAWVKYGFFQILHSNKGKMPRYMETQHSNFFNNIFLDTLNIT